MLMSNFMHDITSKLYLNEKFLTISYLNGVAYGGGAELATCTDMRLASKKAKVAWVHKKIALQPGWGGAARLTSLLGPQSALYMLLTAKPFDAEELINIRFCAPEIVNDIDLWLDKHVLSIPKPVLRVMKQNSVNALKYDYLTALENERALFGTLIGQDANRTALQNMKHKLKK